MAYRKHYRFLDGWCAAVTVGVQMTRPPFAQVIEYHPDDFVHKRQVYLYEDVSAGHSERIAYAEGLCKGLAIDHGGFADAE